jgi:D-alanyl-D-alanine carboxypeptidase
MGEQRINTKASFAEFVAGVCSQLGIPEDYGLKRRLSLQQECSHPVSIGPDVFEREQFMLHGAAKAWRQMQKAAAQENIQLLVVSAFRPVDYQAGIVKRKLDNGLSIEEILKVSAAPGYSEHHSGRALDITTPGFDALEEVFETSAAFAWLLKNAARFEFRLSYPRDNPHGVAYEPWHWYWLGPDQNRVI